MSGKRYAWSRALIGGHPLALGYSYRLASDDLIVFLHGLGCWRRSFELIWERPELANFSLMAVDFSGHGHTALPEETDPTMAVQADLLEQGLSAFLRMHPHKRVHFVTHSMGCGIALILPPERLKSLASFSSLEGNLISADCTMSGRVAKVPLDRFGKKMPEGIEEIVGPFSSSIYLDAVKPRAFRICAESLVDLSKDDTLLNSWNALPCPKQYFYGGNEKQEVVASLNPAEVIAVPDAGHFMMQENPDSFYPLLVNFLNK